MRFAVAALVVMGVACQNEPGNNPPGGGGGGVGGSGGGGAIDAGAVTADGAPARVVIQGQVCVRNDLISPLVCPTGVDLEGIQVSVRDVENAFAFTNTAGEFELSTGTTPVGVLTAAEEDEIFRPALITFEASGGEIRNVNFPIMAEEDFDVLQATIGFGEQLGVDGIVTVTVTDAFGTPVTGAVVRTANNVGVVFYNDGDPLIWRSDLLGTGTNGVALVAEVPASQTGTVDLVVETVGGTTVFANVPVSPNAISFERLQLPAL